MIRKADILKNIQELDNLYNSTRNSKKARFFSKLTILESCGWIEETMDEILKKFCKGKIFNPKNEKFFESEIVKRTSGFEYETYFRRKMLFPLIGLINVERIEHKINSLKFTKMVVALSRLHEQRRSHAHTHITGITSRIDAPSVTKTLLIDVYEGLKEYEKELKKIKFR